MFDQDMMCAPRCATGFKPIFTICHGVQILVAVDGVLKGKKVPAASGAAVEVQGAAFVSNHHNMVTVGPARPKHGAFGRSDVGDTSPGSAMWSGRVARLRKVAPSATSAG